MKKIALAVALALGTVAQPVALAGTTTGTMPVSLTVTGTCTSVMASPLNFGSTTSDQVSSSIFGQATITVNCSNSTSYAVTLDPGLQQNGFGNRQLQSAGINIEYFLFSDAARTAAVTSGNLVSTVMGVSGSAAHTVYGTAFFTNGQPIGIYTDTVTITVTY